MPLRTPRLIPPRHGALPALAVATALLAAPLAPADEFWVTDRAGDRVIAFDAESGAYLRDIANTGLSQPTGLTIGPNGQIFVANGSLGDPDNPVAPVVVVDPTGLLGSNVTSFNLGSATSAEAPLFPGGILYDATSDTLLVSEFGQFDGARVFRFNLAGGDPLQTLGAGSASTGRTGMVIRDQQLYVSSFGDFTLPEPLNGIPIGSVLRHDGADGFDLFAAGAGLSATVLLGANGLDFDAAGDLYVASLIGQGIVKYDLNEGMAGAPQSYGQPVAYPSGILVADLSGRESLIVTGLGNNNPNDPIYQGFLFPGQIVRYDLATGANVRFLVGDFNGDLTVDGADLAVWEDAFGATATGDANGDGASAGDDFLAWQRYQGNSGVIGEFQPTAIVRTVATTVDDGAAVPEPASATLVVLLASGAALARRRRRV